MNQLQTTIGCALRVCACERACVMQPLVNLHFCQCAHLPGSKTPDYLVYISSVYHALQCRYLKLRYIALPLHIGILRIHRSC